MELKYNLVEDKITSSRRSDFRSVPSLQRVRSTTQKNARSSSNNNLVEAIAQVHGGLQGVSSQCEEEGVVKVKLVLTKQQVKQLMLLMGNNNNNLEKLVATGTAPAAVSSAALEQRIHAMQKRQLRRSEQLRRGTWKPVLQSIPEEALDQFVTR